MTGKRQSPKLWAKTRVRIFKRDRGECQSPEYAHPKKVGLCQRKMSLSQCHIDHIIPLAKGGTNRANNLRVLCPICHALRADKTHAMLRLGMFADGLLPANYKNLLWD